MQQLMERMASKLCKATAKPPILIRSIQMQVSSKIALVLALGLSSVAAMAGEIQNSVVNGNNAINETNGSYAWAVQSIGVATGTGKIYNSTVNANGARNSANGYGSWAFQEIGAATNGGRRQNGT